MPTPSRASPLPQGISAWIGICASPQNIVGAWLAREGGGLGSTDVECADASRASPLPQGLGCGSRYLLHPRTTVGAWLARESGGSGSTDVECADAFASKPAPTGSGGVHSNRAHHKITVGACLQAIAVGQATWILNGLAPSRAGSLLQGSGYGSGIRFTPDHCGSVACPRKRWVRQHRC